MKEYSFQKILKNELSKRCKNNPLYSLRSFANLLKINPGVLSSVINGKRSLSYRSANQILNGLSLSKEESDLFLDSVVDQQKNRELKRRDPNIKAHRSLNIIGIKNCQFIDEDAYVLIGDWIHTSILELTHCEDFQNSHSWIAGQLGISPLQAKLAVERLLDVGMIVKTEDSIRASNEQFRMPSMYHKTNKFRAEKQKQIRKKAIEAIDEVPIELRSMTSMTMCIDPDLMDEAKGMIQEFNERLSKFLESGKREKVYILEVGLFPIQK